MATNPAAAEPKPTTAEDTLQRKSREAGVVSGGHLVAKALKTEGVEAGLAKAILEVTDDDGEIVLEFPFAEALLDVSGVTKH